MRMPAITFTKESFSQFGEVIEKEWLITNGLGSYGSSTLPGINTRKYHGLLVAALHPPGDRTVCLSKVEEDIIVDNVIHRLGSNEFRDVIYPDGYKLIKQFSINPFPNYIYDVVGVQISKMIFMPKYENAVVLIYKLTNKSGNDAKARIYPLLTCRHFHTVINRFENPLNFTLKTSNRHFVATFQNPKATIICSSTEGAFRESVNWVDQLFYRDEAFRGETNFDDCFQPGYFEVQLPAMAEKDFVISCSVRNRSLEANEILDTVETTSDSIKDAFNHEYNQKIELMASFYRFNPEAQMSDWLNWIILAADSFMVKTITNKKAVIAGYHWFEPWGRDTLISLPGLALVTGKYNDAKDILRSFNQYCNRGLIPNFIEDKTNIPVYNTVDGTLWYVNAILQYVKYTGDFEFVEDELWENMQTIVEKHQEGTLFGIHLDDDDLLMHGSRLTWMDAMAGKDEITPRTGKAVEIQALWYNTLKIMELFAKKFNERNLSEKYLSMAKQTSKSFKEKFWNPKKSCLFDVIDGKNVDESLRPNQIFALSLDFNILDKNKNLEVVEMVSSELVTPYGLRTLSLDDPKFVGKCVGDRRSRDMAYHNGTIWPWLLGPYVAAYLKVNDYSARSREKMLRELILPLFTIGIHQGGLGTINEIYDCDPPNEPRGCIAQAWSVAEPLRAYLEDILQIKPKKAKEVLGT